MVTHSRILAWRIPWTEKPGRLQSTGSQRVGHDWATSPSSSVTVREIWFPVYNAEYSKYRKEKKSQMKELKCRVSSPLSIL